MRRDAVRQLRTVAGYQAAATPQEEAAGISGGQKSKAGHTADVPREGVVLLHAVVRHDSRGIGFGAAVSRAAVRGPGRVHVTGRLCPGTGSVHDSAPRAAGRFVQLHVELVPGGMHQRHVQLQSHLRDVQDGRWRRRRRRWRRPWRRHRRRRRRWSPWPRRWCKCKWRRWRRRRRAYRTGSRTPRQHQGLRVPAGRGLLQLHKGIRRAGLHVPVSLFPAKLHADRSRLRQATAIRRHCPLLRRTVHNLRHYVHRVMRHALRLSIGGHGIPTIGTVQEFRGTLAHRRLQVRNCI